MPRCRNIFFDLETTSLMKTCEIIQIAAIDKSDGFNTYIMPKKNISTQAKYVTGISVSHGVMTHNGQIVTTETLENGLKHLCEWLSHHQLALLIVHNCNRFDSNRWVRHLDISGMLNTFREIQL